MTREKDVEDFYDIASDNYDTHDDRVSDEILEKLMLVNIPLEKLKILDAGAGVGRFAKPLLKQGHKVSLLELSQGMMDKAKENLKSFENAFFTKMSVTSMNSFEDESFSVVLMMNAILDYCGDYKTATKEAFRVLKKGGLLMGSVNNRFIYCCDHELRDGDYALFKKNMGTGDRFISWGGQEKGHISHEFTLDELKNLLRDEGFTIRKIYGPFNLLDKRMINKVRDRDAFVKLQVESAKDSEYINNSSDFFFVVEK